MKRQYASYGLLIVVAAIIFGVLFIQAQRVDQARHNQYRTDLRQLEGLHARLNENVLRAKLGLLTYYDPLNETLTAIDQLDKDLINVPTFISEQGQREIKDAFNIYSGMLDRQKRLIERFETENSVLRNSLSYFTIVVTDLTNLISKANVDPTVSAALNSLLQDILLYNTTADQALIPRIQEEITFLLQNRSALESVKNTVSVDVLISHTNIVIGRKPVIDAAIEEMFALPIPAQITQQSNLYDAYYEVARKNANFYQTLLYLFSLLVVAFIALSIIARLRQSAAVVSAAKEALQVTNIDLEKRSGELELANIGLQKATEDAREANRLKDEFLAVMSHELRTPLNAIIGFQGILLLRNILDERSTHMMTRAQANAERLLALINDILDISRIESGRLQLTPVDVHIAEAVEKWRTQMSVLADEKGLDFSIHIDDELPSVIRIDEDAITKIVTNLLGNAFKFTEKGKVALNLCRNNGSWIIEVADTGVGIPVHMQHIIFDRFRQVDSSSRRKYGGSGLGLAIVHSLCMTMNGTVTVHSTLDQGSTFTVTLPLEATTQEKVYHAS